MRKLFVGATVRTMDPAQPLADVIVVREGKIETVGWRDEVGLISQPGDEVVDLGGKTVIPGFIDAHIHFTQMLWDLSLIDLSRALTVEELQSAIENGIGSGETGEWVIGRGMRSSLIEAASRFAGDVLGGVSEERPAILGSQDMHAALVNRAGLKILESEGVPDFSRNGPVGKAGRDLAVLREEASFSAWRWLEEREKHLNDETFERGIRHLYSLGVTGIYSFERLRDCSAISRHLERSPGLEITVGFYEEDLEKIVSTGKVADLGGLRTGGIKLFIDGSLRSRTALLLEPYEGKSTCGTIARPFDRLCEAGHLATKNGVGLSLHAIGDRAVRIALDLLETLSDGGGQEIPRCRIEHVQLLHPDDVGRFRKLGAVASVQPAHLIGDRRDAEAAWGMRCQRAYPLRSLIEGGARVAFGSDGPAGPVDPLLSIRLAVTRRVGDENPGEKRWYSDEGVSLEEAISSHTVEGAFASGTEGSSGQIRAGNRADLVALTGDPFRSDEDLLKTKIAATFVGGNPVYDKEGSLSGAIK
jgi:predicted amidohydrolase YtcJ